MIYCSMFACITAILAQIRFTLPSLVPITLQTLGIYLIGTLWFMYIMKMSFSGSLIICVLPFLPGDVLKIFIAAALTNKFKNIIKD